MKRLYKSVLWATAPRLHMLADTNGGRGTLQTNGTLAASERGLALRSTSSTTGGARYPFPDRMIGLTNQFTLLVYANLTTLGSNGNLLAVVNSTNEHGLTLRRASTTSQLTLSWNNSARNQPSSSGAIATTDGWSLYAVTKNGDNIAFYRNSTAFGTGTSSDLVNFVTPKHIAVFNPGDITWVEGHQGDVGYAAILAYPLTEGEIFALAADPFSLFAKTDEPALYVAPPSPPPPPPPPAPTANLIASDLFGYAPLPVKFTDGSTGDITNRALDVDTSGTIETTALPYTHVYNTPGVYTATLTVTGAGGTSVSTRLITVWEVPAPVSVNGIEYIVELDTTRSGFVSTTPSDDISRRVRNMSWSQGMKGAFEDFAGSSTFTMELDNLDGAFNVEQTTALYHDRLVTGMLVRVKAKHGTQTYQLWIGKISSVNIPPGGMTNSSGTVKAVTVRAECPMKRLLDAEYNPPLIQNVATDTALYLLFNDPVVPFPYDATYWVMDASTLLPTAPFPTRLYQNLIFTAEVGLTTLDYIGDMSGSDRGSRAQSYLRDVVSAEIGGRFWWEGRDGLFKFHNRHHDALAALKLDMTGDSAIDGAESSYSDDIANVVTVKYKPRTVGSAGSVLWSQEDFTLRASEPAKIITARFKDENNPDVNVGALRLELIEPAVDIVARINWTVDIYGNKVGGLQVGHSMYATVEGSGSSAKITLVNPFGQDVQIDLLRLRGTPIYTYTDASITERDAQSILAHDRREHIISLSNITNPDFARGVALQHLQRFSQPRTRWKTVTFTVSAAGMSSDLRYNALFQVRIGDRVRLRETWSGHDAEYAVVGESHSVNDQQKSHAVTWVVKPLWADNFFTIQNDPRGELDGDYGISL